jgi:catechol 2,3-dioxygenase
MFPTSIKEMKYMQNHTIHPDTEIGRVHLKVSNLERSIQFYREVVGFEVLRQERHRAELTAAGESHPLLVLEEIPNAVIPARRGTTGLYHFAILVPTRADLGLSLRNLAEFGIHIGQGDHLVSEALYISDPDNNGIEIYADRPRETWTYNEQGQVQMATDPIEWQSLLDEAGDQVWSGLQKGTKIGHIHLHIDDLHTAKRFYCELLGFEVMAQMADSALFVAAGGYHHHIGLNTWAGVGARPAPEDAVGLRYYTIIIPNMSELKAILTRLEDAGIYAVQQDAGWLVKDFAQNHILLVERKLV